MKMPAARSQQANGFAKRANGFHDDGEQLKSAKLANKKLDLMEQESAKSFQRRPQQAEGEVFHDTGALGAHTGRQMGGQEDEPIVIFDTQSNTSIAQTAKDQFAAALLRLQAGLDDSAARLNAIETKVDDLAARQQRQARLGQEAAASKKLAGGWLSLTSNGHLNTIIYLSWPVLVFVAMRALEKRSLLKKLA